MVWRPDAGNSFQNEAGKIKHLIVGYTRGDVLDVGCGPFKAFPHFIGVDRANVDPGQNPWRTDVRKECTDLAMFGDRSMDAVFSSFLLQSIVHPEDALKEWWRTIKVGGHLVLYLPHATFYPNLDSSSPDGEEEKPKTHDFYPEDIIAAMELIGGWDLVENQERNERDEYAFFQVYKKRKGSKHHHTWKKKAEDKRERCLVIRYGGIGDLIMVASILPALKAEGYHITMNTHPNGPEILGEDPNIDEFLIQDPNQVPNEDLGPYWLNQGWEYDRIANLSESVEGALLTMAGRHSHAISKEARHMLCDVNYLDFTHAIAKVPLTPKSARFYAKATERNVARETRKKMGDQPVVLWSLAGSSVHKFWPWMSEAVLWLCVNTDFKVILVGDKSCQMIEAGICAVLLKHYCEIDFEDSVKMKLSEVLAKLNKHWGENRVICKSGAWAIRESLAFANEADVVVGTETGLLNAVGLEPVRKVIMLSHSSHENLTRDWVNTTVMEPPEDEVSCYPCHRLHHGNTFCPIGDSDWDKVGGASLCATKIPWAAVVTEIVEQVNSLKLKVSEAAD